jgi:DNA polymerase-3 subunit gamma/tau
MYQSLYRKWRPKSFDDVVGQAHITETLKRQVATGRLSHAYLFVGTRGTGKTTCAKILSRAINCQSPENGNPCNKCSSCLGIEDGSILDVLELDAASNNGVDNVRALREEAVFTPVNVRKRVYIIDEVHMLSTAAFNALLKILEEPPAHLIFILATTEIHKVPATILSRCQRFTFKRGLPTAIAERLLNVANHEGIALTGDAAALLARLSDGSFRDALSLLDQCASDKQVNYDSVVSAIGLAGETETAALLGAIAENDAAAALRQLDGLYLGGKVMTSVLEELTNLVRDVLVTALIPKGGAGLLTGGFDEKLLQDFSKRLTAERLLSMTDILRETSLSLSKSAGGRLAVELCLMRLCDTRLSGDMTSVLSRISQLEEKTSCGTVSAPPVSPENRFAPPAPQQPAVIAPEKTVPVEAVAVPSERAVTPELPVSEPATAENPEVTAVSGPAPGAAESAAADESSEALWNNILRHIKSKIDIPLYSIMCDSTQASARFGDGTLTIRTRNPFAARMIDVPPVVAVIKEVAAEVMKKPVVVRITQEDESVGGGADKLDALKGRFSGVIKFEE